MGMTTWWLIAPVLVVFWLVLVGAIVWMSIALAKALRAKRADEATAEAGAPMGETPLATLQRRLALGEVDVETFERSVAALQRTAPAVPAAPGNPAAEPQTTGEPR